VFFRFLAYVFTGWLLMAAVSGLAPVLHLSIVLPATTAILLTHLAFSDSGDLHWGLGIAVTLGYLEDLHQGAPIGLLCLVHALSWLAVYLAARRFTLVGPASRILAATAVAGGIDLLTYILLIALAEPLGFTTDALNAAWVHVGWHLVGTALFVPAVWLLADKFSSVLDELLHREPLTVDGGRRMMS
jgi:hypothetical protein